MKIVPGDFVEATRDNGTKLYGFVERIIDSTTDKAVLPRAARRANDRFVVRPLLGKPMTPFTDESGTITSDIDPRSEKAVIEMALGEAFKKENVKLLAELPGENVTENNVAADDFDFKFPGSLHQKQGLVSLHTRLHVDKHFECCLVCGDIGYLMMCETCTGSGHLHCQAPPLAELPTYEWRCHKCNNKPSPLGSAVRFKRLLKRLILEFCELDVENHFAHPVSIWFVVPTYANTIPYPVDLSMMIQKADKACYKNVLEVVADLDTLVDNCKKFNEGTLLAGYAADFHTKATELVKKFRAELRKEDISDSYSNELMGLAAGFTSEYQVNRVNPGSVSIFGHRAFPLGVRNLLPKKGNTNNNTNNQNNNNNANGARPPEPIIFPMLKLPASSTNLLTPALGLGGEEQNNNNNNQPRHHHNLRRLQNVQNAARGGGGGTAEERLLQQRALQLPEHVTKDPNFSFPHPLRVTFANPCCNQGELRMIYTIDGSHPAKSAYSKVYDGKPILIAPKCVTMTSEEVQKKLEKLHLKKQQEEEGMSLVSENGEAQQETATSIKISSEEMAEIEDLLAGEKVTIKAICSLPHQMINPEREDDKTRSSVVTISYKFASPFINHEQHIMANNSIQQHHQQQRKSVLRQINSQTRKQTTSAVANSTTSKSILTRSQQQHEQGEEISVESLKLNPHENVYLKRANAGKRRTRNVHFADSNNENENSKLVVGGPEVPMSTSSLSNSATAFLLENILPKKWIKPSWIDVFLDRIETCEDLKSEEKRMYRKVAMRFVAFEKIDSSGIHPDDWQRVVRDYLLFVTMNVDQIPTE